MTMRYWTLLAALLIALNVSAQQQTGEPEKHGRGQKMGHEQMMSDDMMRQCREHMQGMMQSHDQLNQRIEDAKRSNDPEQMRAALDEAQRALHPHRQQMRMCMKMMDMMHMHEGMMSGDEQQKKQTEKPDQPNEPR